MQPVVDTSGVLPCLPAADASAAVRRFADVFLDRLTLPCVLRDTVMTAGVVDTSAVPPLVSLLLDTAQEEAQALLCRTSVDSVAGPSGLDAQYTVSPVVRALAALQLRMFAPLSSTASASDAASVAPASFRALVDYASRVARCCIGVLSAAEDSLSAAADAAATKARVAAALQGSPVGTLLWDLCALLRLPAVMTFIPTASASAVAPSQVFPLEPLLQNGLPEVLQRVSAVARRLAVDGDAAVVASLAEAAPSTPAVRVSETRDHPYSSSSHRSVMTIPDAVALVLTFDPKCSCSPRYTPRVAAVSHAHALFVSLPPLFHPIQHD